MTEYVNQLSEIIGTVDNDTLSHDDEALRSALVALREAIGTKDTATVRATAKGAERAMRPTHPDAAEFVVDLFEGPLGDLRGNVSGPSVTDDEATAVALSILSAAVRNLERRASAADVEIPEAFRSFVDSASGETIPDDGIPEQHQSKIAKVVDMVWTKRRVTVASGEHYDQVGNLERVLREYGPKMSTKDIAAQFSADAGHHVKPGALERSHRIMTGKLDGNVPKAFPANVEAVFVDGRKAFQLIDD